ncbi:hypothetical protein X975_03164, partial [Stegodyphus mimosarum]
MNDNFSFMKSMVMPEYTVFQANSPPPHCTAKASTTGIILWEMFSWVALGPLLVVEQTLKPVDYLSITADQLHPYMVSVFPNWK